MVAITWAIIVLLGYLRRLQAPELAPATGVLAASGGYDARMGIEDKLKNTAENVQGEVKEHVGGATGNRDLQAEGVADQDKSDLKQAGEKIKDVFKN